MRKGEFDGPAGAMFAATPARTRIQRYSDVRQAEDFSVVVLFSSAFECTRREIVSVIAQSFPNLGIEELADLDRHLHVGKQDWTTCLRSNNAGTRLTSTLSSDAGAYPQDMSHALRNSYAFAGAKKAMSHSSWIKITTPSDGIDHASRFRAAMTATCIAAEFSRLSNCLGVFVPGANQIVSPKRWVRAANQADRHEFPVDAWIALAFNQTEQDGGPRMLHSCSSIGLAAFSGHEVHLPWSDMEPEAAIRLVHTALWLQMVKKRTFGDGHTMGERANPKRIRIRQAKEGTHGLQTDAWLLFDQTTVISEARLFGSQTSNEEPTPKPRASAGDRLDRLDRFLKNMFLPRALKSLIPGSPR